MALPKPHFPNQYRNNKYENRYFLFVIVLKQLTRPLRTSITNCFNRECRHSNKQIKESRTSLQGCNKIYSLKISKSFQCMENLMLFINLKTCNLLPFIWFIICITKPQPNRASNRNMNPMCWDEVGKEKPSRFALSGLSLLSMVVPSYWQDPLRTSAIHQIPLPSQNPTPSAEADSFQLTHFFSQCVAFYNLLI